MKRAGWLFALVLVTAGAGWAAGPVTSCTVCHSDADLFDESSLQIMAAYEVDVHASVGLSCHDCHGGNPDPALADDIEAMDEGYEQNPYRGVPERTEIPAFCGSCHSDPRYMRAFRPDARVDQEREYWTSQHGVALAEGDVNVATCVDCHSHHDILRAADPQSPVYPAGVAETCRSCHENAETMSGYERPDGSSLPIDQYARWRQSVHAETLLDRGDLFAPTCNDCHGNHGAAPPGLESVSFVCGQCHGREAEIFRASPKHAGFERHNEYLVDAGEESCALCHEGPQTQRLGFPGFRECTVCHGNHGTVRPSVAMFSALPETPCAFCHETATALEPEKSWPNYQAERDRLLGEAAANGYEGEELFNWLVDQAEILPSHTVSSLETAPMRPEFARLYDKFRIGKTYYTYTDPVTGEPTRGQIVRCGTCHETDEATEERGAKSGIALVNRMHELTSATARAERVLLAARRGGVETREALLSVDQAIDAQIGLEVLVHTFSVEEDSPFIERYTEGLEHAENALEEAQLAMRELGFRRRGLAVSLVVIALLLVALGLKIREMSRREDRGEVDSEPAPSSPA